MKAFAIAAALSTASLLCASGAIAQTNVSVEATNPVVDLQINEVVRSAPDVAIVNAGVTTRAATAREAIQQNANQMDRLVKRMRDLGIAAKDIQTSNFNLNPNYQYNQQTGEQVFNGYNVNNQVTVNLRKLDRAGEVLDALVQAGANNIYGPNFALEDDAAAKETARKNAFERGFAQARTFARMAGYSDVRLLSVAESMQGYGPVPQAAIVVTASRDISSAATPIEPGEVGVGVSLGMKFEMTL